jgi:hypothetical protein
MIRRQRKLIAGLKFPRRVAQRVAVSLDGPGREVFVNFRRFVQQGLQESARANRYLRQALQVLAESFHSSPAAFAGQCDDFLRRFRNLLPREAQEGLRGYREAMTAELLGSKVRRAADILRLAAGHGGKVLVFSQYEDTADLLSRELPKLTGLTVVRYPDHEGPDGGLKALEALRRFRHEAAASAWPRYARCRP